jgi:hypothetical protein
MREDYEGGDDDDISTASITGFAKPSLIHSLDQRISGYTICGKMEEMIKYHEYELGQDRYRHVTAGDRHRQMADTMTSLSKATTTDKESLNVNLYSSDRGKYEDAKNNQYL